MTWEACKAEMQARDGKVCLVWLNASLAERKILKEKSGGQLSTVDAAHIFGKGAYPHMALVSLNICPLNRYSHEMLDNNRDPITGERIGRKGRAMWFATLVGVERYKILCQIARGEYGSEGKALARKGRRGIDRALRKAGTDGGGADTGSAGIVGPGKGDGVAGKGM